MQAIIDLINQFGLEGIVSFYKKEELYVIRVTNKYAHLDLALCGAQVLSFAPVGEKDLLWMSPASEFKTGTPVRGGIPLCFPWFGPHDTDKSLPQHGFARLLVWNLEEVSQQANDETFIRLSLKSSPETLKYWASDFYAELTVVVGEKLEVNLMIKNTGSEALMYTSALHTYFGISDIEKIAIEGLKDTSYYWGFTSERQSQAEELLVIEKEENRRYVETGAVCTIKDEGWGREIVAGKNGSLVTVVWNPWKENCRQIGDIPDEAYRSFVCVEAANAYADVVELQSGGQHTTSVILGLKK